MCFSFLSFQTSQYSKLEKADILEMTVKHLRSMQRQQLALAAATDNTVVSKYRAGFTECAQEVTRYLGQVDGLASDTKSRLLHHLEGVMHRMHSHASQGAPMSHQSAVHLPAAHQMAPIATGYHSLPGAIMTSPQQIMTSPQQQVAAVMLASAQLQALHAARPAAAAAGSAAIPQSTSPSVIQYATSIQMPAQSHSQHHHCVSPVSATEAPTPESFAMKREHSPVLSAVSSTIAQTPVTNSELKIEIPSPSPQPKPVQSTTPILKCVSPYATTANMREAFHSHIPVNHAIATERVWRPW